MAPWFSVAVEISPTSEGSRQRAMLRPERIIVQESKRTKSG